MSKVTIHAQLTLRDNFRNGMLWKSVMMTPSAGGRLRNAG
jgi:hypothetical protein